MQKFVPWISDFDDFLNALQKQSPPHWKSLHVVKLAIRVLFHHTSLFARKERDIQPNFQSRKYIEGQTKVLVIV